MHGRRVDCKHNICQFPFQRQVDATKRSVQFRNIDKSALDPLVRFREKILSPEEHFRKVWATPDGYRASAFRALVGAEACQSSCFYCSKSTLRWNATTVSYPHWTKLFCETCKSTYEVKASNTKPETFRERLKRGVLDNTPYYDAFRNLKGPGKRYIALVNTEGTGPHQVSLCEIVQVDPQLKDRSFIGDKARIFSRTKFNVIKESWMEIGISSSEKAKTIHENVDAMLDKKFEKEKVHDGPSQNSKPSTRDCLNHNMKDYRRDLKRQLRRIDELKKSDDSKWTPDDRKLVEKEEALRDEVKMAEQLIYPSSI